MKHENKTILLTMLTGLMIWLTLAAPVPLYAQGGDPPPARGKDLKFEHLTPAEGLPSLAAQGIAQDSQGFMWFATSNGLYRYDGYTFKAFHNDPDDPHSLSAENVGALYEDHEGVLWVGSMSGGLNAFDRATEQFTRYLYDPADPHSLSHNRVNAIYEDRSGRLWLGTDGGLDRFDRATGQFMHYRHDPNDRLSLSHNQVEAIAEDPSGQLWLGTQGGGLNRFDPATGQFTRYQHDPNNSHGLSHDNVWIIAASADGSLWVGTGGGLDRFDPASGQFTRYQHDPADPHSLSDNDVNALYEDVSGEVWVGTTGGGLNLFDPKTETFTRYQPDPAIPYSFWGEWVEFIYADRTGALWFATLTDGVNRLDRAVAKFELYQHNPSDPQSLSSSSTWAIFQDHLGILWVGTTGGGLNKLDPATAGFRHYQHDPADPHSLSDNQVYAIVEDPTGNLWIGTRGGLNRFDRASEQFTRYTHDPSNPASLSENWVVELYVDRSGRLWISAFGGGLNKFDPATGRFSHYLADPTHPNSLSDNRVITITEDPSGVLWLGTLGGGLNKFDPETETFTHYRYEPDNPNSLSSDQVTHIYIEQADALWLATAGGLDKFDPQTETFVHYREKDGLASKNLVSIVADEQGNLWLGTHGGGLSRFDPDRETFKNYDQSDGLQGNEFVGQGAYRDTSGKLYFAGKNGLNAFYPDQLTDNPYVPPVVLTDFQIFNQSEPIGGKDSPLQQVINETGEITLSYQQSVFSFEFAALNYRAPEKNQYTYMLEGFDADWNYVDSSRRFATYTNLDPGTYTFRVKASNNDGVWNEAGKAIKITITPPWWQTWRFYTLCVAGVLGIFGLIYQSKTNQLRTERAAALALRESEERFRSIFSQSPIGIELYDKEGLLIDANSVCLDMFGVKNLEVVKGFKLFEDPNLPEDAKKRLSNGESVRYEIMFDFETVKAQNLYETTKSGQCFLECFLTQWGSGSGDLKGFLVHVTDITERKRIEEALRENEARYRAVIESQVDLISRYLPDTTLTFVNDAYCQFYGKTREELIGQSYLSMVAPEFRELARKETEDLSKDPRPLAGEYLNYRHDGKECWIQWVVQCISDENGRVVELQAVGRDITERKQAEAQLKRNLRETRVRYEISQALAGAETEDEVLDGLIQHAGLYPQAHVTIFTFDRTGGELAIILSRDNPLESGVATVVPIGARIPASRYPVLDFFSAGEPFISENALIDERIDSTSREGIRQSGGANLAIFPLTVGNEWMGFVLAMAKPPGYFDEEKQRLYQTLAEQGAVALRAARLRETIRESQQRLSLLVQQSPLAVIEWNMDFEVVSWNPAAERIFGYTGEEALGRHASLIVPEQVRPLVDQVWQDLLAQKGGTYSTNENLTKDGRSITCEWFNAPLVGVGGQVIGVASLVQDVTQRKQVEEALRESEERFRQVLESLQDVAYRRNLQTDTYDYMSPAQLHISGYTAEEILLAPTAWVVGRIHPDDLDHVMRALEESMAGGQGSCHLEYRFKCKDGQYRWMSDLSTIVRDAQGRPLYRVGTLRDMTERKQTEEEIRKLNEELEQRVARRTRQIETVAEISQQLTSILDLPTLLREVVTITKETFGYYHVHIYLLAEECKTLIMTEGYGETGDKMKQQGHQIPLDAPTSLVARAARQREIVLVNDVRQATDWLSNPWLPDTHSEMTVPIIAEEKVIGVLDVQSDKVAGLDEGDKDLLRSLANHVAVAMTNAQLYKKEKDLRQAEAERAQELAKLNADLKAAQAELLRQERLATLGQLTATVSHEIRNPLATIRASAFAIDGKTRDKDLGLEPALDRIQRNITRCDNIISELLDYTRMPGLNLQLIHIDHWLHQVLDEQTLPEGITLSRKLTAGVEISLDPERFRRVIINLVDNACQAMLELSQSNDKPLVLSIQSEVVGQQLRISISDTGPGIPPDVMSHIFTPLYSTKGFGVGLGLSVVQEIVKQHKGKIEITSEVGQGTQATLWLPLL